MTSAGGGRGTGQWLYNWFFSYETFKVLRVRDVRLGGLYRLFQASILAYIATSIIYQQRYLKLENIVNGAVRITLKAPSDGIATSSYCNPPKQPCLYWNENDILYEPGTDGALITTRLTVTKYGPFDNVTASHCNINMPTTPTCDPYKAPTNVTLPASMVSDIERYTIMLEHSIRGATSGVQLRSGNMVAGTLVDSISGGVVKTYTNDTRITTDSSGKTTRLAGDVMTVGELVKAAGVDLDQVSRAPSASVGESVRSAGVVIIVVIRYAAKGWNPGLISYEYLPKAISDQEYKVIETIRDFREGSRVEFNRHGIRVVISQAGQLGEFSFMTLLTNIVAAIALFKVANVVVELMMLRIHPHKKVYVRAKFENTNNPNGGAGGTTTRFVAQSDTEDVGEQQRPESPSTIDLGRSGMRGRGGTVDSTRMHKAAHENKDGYDDSSSDSDDSEQDIVEQLGVRRRVVKATTESENAFVNRSRSTGVRINRSGVVATEVPRTSTKKDTNRHRPRSSGLSSGMSGKSFDPTTKPTAGVAVMDLNKNGSSSALISNATPGVAGASMRRYRGSMDQVEIETRFGVLRVNDFKGFDPEGLTSGRAALSSSSSHASSGSNSGTFPPSNRSHTSMRSASPTPADIEQEHDRTRTVATCVPKETRHRSRRHAALKLGVPPMVLPEFHPLSYQSSSPPSSGPPTCSSTSSDDPIDGAADRQSVDGGSNSTPANRRGNKKRRKECRVTPTTVSMLRTKQEASVTRPLFGQGGQGTQSALLRSGADTKGKQRDQSGLSDLILESPSKQDVFKDYVPPTPCNDTLGTTMGSNALSVSMTEYQLPMPTCLSEGTGHLLDLDMFSTESHNVDAEAVRSSFESSAVASAYLPARHADWRFPTESDTIRTNMPANVDTEHSTATKIPGTVSGSCSEGLNTVVDSDNLSATASNITMRSEPALPTLDISVGTSTSTTSESADDSALTTAAPVIIHFLWYDLLCSTGNNPPVFVVVAIIPESSSDDDFLQQGSNIHYLDESF
ncbi:cytochrome c oxidase subunit 1 [Mortierella sp. GBA43]|nr:cytochrome c oxidase subunit 1 [Mortierella sp. GBA43]